MFGWPLVLAATLAVSAAPRDVGTTPRSLDDHLRPRSPSVVYWLQLAKDRSPTVRDLADRIAHGDVIVYLDVQKELGPDVSACVRWMAATPSQRFVRVSLRAGLRPMDAVAMIAHELQHVVEVAEHPEVRSSGDLLALYRRIGHSTSSTHPHFDTAAAVAAGHTARTEALTATGGGDSAASAA